MHTFLALKLLYLQRKKRENSLEGPSLFRNLIDNNRRARGGIHMENKTSDSTGVSYNRVIEGTPTVSQFAIYYIYPNAYLSRGFTMLRNRRENVSKT